MGGASSRLVTRMARLGGVAAGGRALFVTADLFKGGGILERTLVASLTLSGSSPVWDRFWTLDFLASAMIIFYHCAAGGPSSQCSYIYVVVRLHSLRSRAHQQSSQCFLCEPQGSHNKIVTSFLDQKCTWESISEVRDPKVKS